jgi:hypothetical protein
VQKVSQEEEEWVYGKVKKERGQVPPRGPESDSTQLRASGSPYVISTALHMHIHLCTGTEDMIQIKAIESLCLAGTHYK